MKKSAGIFLGLFSIFILNIPCYADESNYMEDVKDKNEVILKYPEWIDEKTKDFKYPISPAMPVWGELDTYEEMVEVCTIPQDILKIISTQELTELVLNYPLISEIYLVGESELDGFETMKTNFNGIHELMERQDLYEVLKNEYENKDIIKVSEEEIFTTISQIELIEMILTDKEIIDDLTEKEKEETADLIYNKFIEKEKSNTYCKSSTFVYKNAFMNNTIDTIADVKENILQSSVNYVYTPKGTPVPVSVKTYSGSKWSDALTQEISKEYPQARAVYPADNRYNCHSYAWYNSSMNNSYWMNDPSAYWLDGSYREIGTTPISGGKKIIYWKTGSNGKMLIKHSGNVMQSTSTSATIVSKWGQGPVMIHDVNYVPAAYGYGTDTKYYTDK